MAYSRGVVAYRDQSRKVVTTSFDGVAQVGTGAGAVDTSLWDALVSALQGITAGTLAVNWWGDYAEDDTVPVSPQAQSFIQWRFQYTVLAGTDAGKQYQGIRVATADLSLANSNDQLDLAGTEGAALKTAFEAFYRHKGDQTAVTRLDNVFLVGLSQ